MWVYILGWFIHFFEVTFEAAFSSSSSAIPTSVEGSGHGLHVEEVWVLRPSPKMFKKFSSAIV